MTTVQSVEISRQSVEVSRGQSRVSRGSVEFSREFKQNSVQRRLVDYYRSQYASSSLWSLLNGHFSLEAGLNLSWSLPEGWPSAAPLWPPPNCPCQPSRGLRWWQLSYRFVPLIILPISHLSFNIQGWNSRMICVRLNWVQDFKTWLTEKVDFIFFPMWPQNLS